MPDTPQVLFLSPIRSCLIFPRFSYVKALEFCFNHPSITTLRRQVQRAPESIIRSCLTSFLIYHAARSLGLRPWHKSHLSSCVIDSRLKRKAKQYRRTRARRPARSRKAMEEMDWAVLNQENIANDQAFRGAVRSQCLDAAGGCDCRPGGCIQFFKDHFVPAVALDQ